MSRLPLYAGLLVGIVVALLVSQGGHLGAPGLLALVGVALGVVCFLAVRRNR